MGNRGVIELIHSGGSLYFYAHWDDLASLTFTVGSVLAKKVRWDDEDYLSRMIFCKMIKDDVDGETGYGIGVGHFPTLNKLTVNCVNRTVTIYDQTYTFQEFVDKHLESKAKLLGLMPA